MKIEVSVQSERVRSLDQSRAGGELLDFVLSEAGVASGPFRRVGPSPANPFRESLIARLAKGSDETERLAAQIRATDCLTTTLGEWLRQPLRYVSALHEIAPVAEEMATRLGIEPGSPVTYRRGHLEMAGGEQHVVADVRAVVAHDSLDPKEKLALESRTVALGRLLQRRGMRRNTHAVTTTSDLDDTGRRILKVAATLAVAGQSVAVVDEVVYENALALPHPHRRIVESTA